MHENGLLDRNVVIQYDLLWSSTLLSISRKGINPWIRNSFA